MKSFELKVAFFLIFCGIHTISHGAETTLYTTDEVMIASCHLNEKK